MTKTSRLVPLVAVLASLSTLSAQRLAESASPSQHPAFLGSLTAHADFNGDGLVDVLSMTNQSATWQLSVNDGTGLLSDWQAVAAPPGITAPGINLVRVTVWTAPSPVGDFDGDGDLDVLYMPRSNTAPLTLIPHIAWNDGTGAFPTSSSLPTTDTFDYSFASDVDADGDVDIVAVARQVALNPSDIRIWLNNGTGSFQPGQLLTNFTFREHEIFFIDQDGDGDLDLFAGVLWDSNGDGTFTDRTLSRFPLGLPLGSPMKAGDLTGDGLYDVATPAGVWADDGSGSLTLDAVLNAPANNLELLDIENDGDLDVITVASSNGSTRTWFNDGSGNFTQPNPSVVPIRARDIRVVVAEDVDVDGDQDLIVNYWNAGDAIYLSDGQGHFYDASPSPLPERSEFFEAAKAADLDGDGALEIIVRDGAQLLVYRNDGFSHFLPVNGNTVFVAGPTDMDFEFADFDGDGHLDAAFGVSVFQGDGAGGLTQAFSTPFAISVFTVTDYDLDGDPDIATPRNIYRNDGGFSFTLLNAGLPTFGSGTSIAAVDVDGDGFEDLVVSTTTGPDQLFLNDTNGSFVDVTAAAMPAVNDYSERIVPADVDGDGDFDLLVPTIPQSGGPWELRAYENLGGTFALATQSLLGVVTEATDVTTADFDLDGDLDVLGNAFDVTKPVLLESTPAGFVDGTATWLGPQRPGTRVFAADVDDDGDVDVLTHTGSRRIRVMHNLHRQFTARNLGRTGNVLRFRAHHEAADVDIVIPFLSPLRYPTAIPTPWGSLRANASIALVLATQTATSGAPAEWQVSVPLDTGLIGLTLYGQAVFADPAGELYLSNAVRCEIIE